MSECTFKKNKGCSILNEKSCGGCVFKKTEKQLADSRAKARERIEFLPEDIRRYIKDKFYGCANRNGVKG